MPIAVGDRDASSTVSPDQRRGAPSRPGTPVTVLFLSKHMNVGGGEYVLRALVERLDRSRFRPVLACLDDEGRFGRQLREQGVPTYSRLLRHKADIAVVLRLRKLMNHEHVGLLYLLDYPSAMLWGGLAARLGGIRSIVAIHSNALWELGGSAMFVGRKLLPWHDRLVTIAAFQKERLVAAEGLSQSKIEVIPNGIDLTRYGAGTAMPSRRRLFGFPEDSFVIGTVAVLRPEKNIAMLFNAALQLVANGRDVRVAIIGDGSERDALQEITASLGLAERVRFLGYRDQPASLLPAFDVFVLTSRSEVMPISILEAMACELPVVATAVGAVPEMVVDGETGFIVASGDVDALADRLARLANAPELRRQMGRQGGERVRSLFGLDRMIERSEALLADADARGAARGKARR